MQGLPVWGQSSALAAVTENASPGQAQARGASGRVFPGGSAAAEPDALQP